MPDMNIYFFEYKIQSGGIGESDMDEQAARDQLNRELAAIYGPNTVTVTTFRLANDEETSNYLAQKSFPATSDQPN